MVSGEVAANSPAVAIGSTHARRRWTAVSGERGWPCAVDEPGNPARAGPDGEQHPRQLLLALLGAERRQHHLDRPEREAHGQAGENESAQAGGRERAEPEPARARLRRLGPLASTQTGEQHERPAEHASGRDREGVLGPTVATVTVVSSGPTTKISSISTESSA